MTPNPANDNIFDTSTNLVFKVNDAINFSDNCKIDNENYVGSIEMFISDQLPPNYLLCNGQQITSSAADTKYQKLIDVLRGSGHSSAYLPDFSGCIPFGWKGSFDGYNSATANHEGSNSIDIEYFPVHNHSLINDIKTNVEYDCNITYIINKTGNDSITIDNFSNLNNIHQRANDAKNLSTINNHSHTHNINTSNGGISESDVIFNKITCLTQFNQGAFNMTTNNTGTSISNDPNDPTNINLTLSSYKLFFGIRFK